MNNLYKLLVAGLLVTGSSQIIKAYEELDITMVENQNPAGDKWRYYSQGDYGATKYLTGPEAGRVRGSRYTYSEPSPKYPWVKAHINPLDEDESRMRYNYWDREYEKQQERRRDLDQEKLNRREWLKDLLYSAGNQFN